ncbi:MAG: PH domain-containing protein [Candidatus Aenigmatarchaeota archaeon]|nr:MAG: PH domain-containing protein [Candidatus Aenigmarchaeota archaeon]
MQETPMKLHPTRLAFLKYYAGAVVALIVWYALYANVLGLERSVIELYGPYVILLVVVAFILVVAAEVHVLTDAYAITDRGMTQRVGILSIKESSVTWDRVADVQMHQSFFERILGIGTIVVQSSGGDEEPEVLMRSVGGAVRVKQTIDDKIHESKAPRQAA